MLLYIIRHGETDTNARGLLCGQVDQPLNDNGRLLARITGEGLRGTVFNKIYASPLSRAYETAELIRDLSGNAGVEIKPDPRLMEIAWGSWEMKCSKSENPELPCNDFNDFYRDIFSFPLAEDGETVYELINRAAAFLADMTSECEDPDTVLIATHGVCARALMRPAFEDKHDFWHGPCPPNCAVNILEYKNGEYRVLEQDKIYYDESLCPNLFKLE